MFPQSHKIQPVWSLRIILPLESKAKQEVEVVGVTFEVEAVGEAQVVVVQADK